MNLPRTKPKKPAKNIAEQNATTPMLAGLSSREAAKTKTGIEAHIAKLDAIFTPFDAFTVNALSHWRPRVNV